MKYQFRKGPIFGESIVEYTFNSVRCLNADGRVKREIWFSNIKELHEFTGISAINERGQRFTIHLCRVVPNFGRSINFQSSSFLEPGPRSKQIARNQFSNFDRLKRAIRERAADANPDVKVVLGEKLTCWIGYATIGIGLAIIGLIAYVARHTDPIATAIGGGLFFSPIFLLGWWVAKTYRPVRIPIRETLPGGPVTENTKLYRDAMQS